MGSARMVVGVALAAATVSLGLGAGGVAAASTRVPTSTHQTDQPTADAGAATQERSFEYTVQNLPAYGRFEVQYRAGVVEAAGGEALADPGGIRNVAFLDNATRLSTGDRSVDVDVTAWLTVDGTSITGVPEIPAGATATATNVDTHQTIDLANGVSFTLPTGAKAPDAGS